MSRGSTICVHTDIDLKGHDGKIFIVKRGSSGKSFAVLRAWLMMGTSWGPPRARIGSEYKV